MSFYVYEGLKQPLKVGYFFFQLAPSFSSYIQSCSFFLACGHFILLSGYGIYIQSMCECSNLGVQLSDGDCCNHGLAALGQKLLLFRLHTVLRFSVF